MSGVVKDDPNPNPEGGEVPEGAASAPEAEAISAETEAKLRRAPHLRVVGAQDPAEAPASDDDAEPAGLDAGPHQRIGTIIRNAREARGLTLEQVSKETKIHMSHLRAIEDMTPSLLGAPVYAKGNIKTYAKHLGLDQDLILNRYLSECAILTDPEKKDIAPPAASSRKLPVAVPVLGLVIVGLVAGGAFFMFAGDQSQAPAANSQETSAPITNAGVAAAPAVVRPQLRLVAVKPARLEVRSADGDKFVSKDVEAGYTYIPRVGAGWTITTNDGGALEWRLGDQSLGPVSTDTGWVYAQSVDLAATRTPIVTETPPEVAAQLPPVTTPGAGPAATPPAASGAPAATAPAAPRPRPRPAQPPADPSIAAEQVVPPAVSAAPPPTPAIAPQTPASDPSLQAYPSTPPSN